MKAAILETPGKLILDQVAMPSCPDGGLIVKTQACSICSSDVKMFQRGHRDAHYPRILGHELAGIIVESRSQGSTFQTGDRVQVFPGICCGLCPACRRGVDNQCEHIGIIGFSHDGGFAEFLVVPPQSVAGGGVNLIPEGVSYEEAALTEPLSSCINGQQLAGVTEGDTVLILGAGPIGLLHAMLARVRGASRIVIAECSPDRLSMSGIAKIDRKIDINQESTAMVIREETGGRGADVILIASSEVVVSALPDLLASRGRLCLFSGLPPEGAQIALDTNPIHYKELTIVGAYGSTAGQNSAALRLIASGKVPVARLITRRISLDEIHDGMGYVANREGMKAVITFH